MRVSRAPRAGAEPAHTAGAPAQRSPISVQGASESLPHTVAKSRELVAKSREPLASVGCGTGLWARWVWLRSIPPASSWSSPGRWVPGPQLPPGPLLLRAPSSPRPRPVRLRAASARSRPVLWALGPRSRPLPRPTSPGAPTQAPGRPLPGLPAGGGTTPAPSA